MTFMTLKPLKAVVSPLQTCISSDSHDSLEDMQSLNQGYVIVLLV